MVCLDEKPVPLISDTTPRLLPRGPGGSELWSLYAPYWSRMDLASVRQLGNSRVRRPPIESRLRLRPGDRRALNQRAAQRGIRSSTYLAALVRAHIASSPPLTIDELAILKQGVAVLAKLSYALSHTARCIAQDGTLPPELRNQLSLTRTVVAALEERMHDLARSALITWESRYD